MKKVIIYDELLQLATNAEIVVRKDKLSSTRGGYCILDDNKLILLNKMLPADVQAKMLARCLGEIDIQNSGMFIPPVVREFIENEMAVTRKEEEIEFVIEKKPEEMTETAENIEE
ncbi:MAG: hypothetical protein LBO69_03405 [Ignavibacteria bacterium]|jgi:hypothetical protein|nr:hypothetical protein [Ignavibacteria bacterium]